MEDSLKEKQRSNVNVYQDKYYNFLAVIFKIKESVANQITFIFV